MNSIRSLCIQKLDHQQTIKYGALLYLTAAMLFVTIGICNHSLVGAPYPEPAMDQVTPLPGVPAMDRSADTVAAFEQTAVQQKASAPSEPVAPALPFEEHILQAARIYQVDPTLIRAVIMAESSYNPKAVSHRGAQGLMQLMPRTAKWLGIEDAFNPALNIDGGVRYLRRLLDRFGGDVKLALAAYNAGSRHVRKYGGVPPFKATRIYIKKVLNYQREFQGQTAAGDGSGSITG